MKNLTQFITENAVDNLPDVVELGDGVFNGTIYGSCFTYNGKNYKSELGALNIFPSPATIEIKDGKVISLK